MSTDVVMQLVCPHCDYHLFETVSLIRPNASAYCPACCKSFVLDPEIEAMSRLLGEAHASRKERKRRRQELQAAWRAPLAPPSPAAPPSPPSPQLLSDVLARLDQLLLEMQEPTTTRKRA